MPDSSQDLLTITPQPGDVMLDDAFTPESIWAQVQINCTSDSGVFFFRYQGRFYMRTVSGS